MLIKPFPKVENIHVIAFPIPDFSDLITANVYAVGKGPITLIDTGPKIPGSLKFIQEQIKLGGFDIEDIERIIITHGHADHFGLAVSIREAAKHSVECFIQTEDKWRIISENFIQDMWSKEMDCSVFDFMGGRKGVFRFKSTFSSSRGSFFTYKKIHNREIHEVLVDCHKRYWVLDDKVSTEYFPSYRKKMSECPKKS